MNNIQNYIQNNAKEVFNQHLSDIPQPALLKQRFESMLYSQGDRAYFQHTMNELNKAQFNNIHPDRLADMRYLNERYTWGDAAMMDVTTRSNGGELPTDTSNLDQAKSQLADLYVAMEHDKHTLTTDMVGSNNPFITILKGLATLENLFVPNKNAPNQEKEQRLLAIFNTLGFNLQDPAVTEMIKDIRMLFESQLSPFDYITALIRQASVGNMMIESTRSDSNLIGNNTIHYVSGAYTQAMEKFIKDPMFNVLGIPLFASFVEQEAARTLKEANLISNAEVPRVCPHSNYESLVANPDILWIPDSANNVRPGVQQTNEFTNNRFLLFDANNVNSFNNISNNMNNNNNNNGYQQQNNNQNYNAPNMNNQQGNNNLVFNAQSDGKNKGGLSTLLRNLKETGQISGRNYNGEVIPRRLDNRPINPRDRFNNQNNVGHNNYNRNNNNGGNNTMYNNNQNYNNQNYNYNNNYNNNYQNNQNYNNQGYNNYNNNMNNNNQNNYYNNSNGGVYNTNGAGYNNNYNQQHQMNRGYNNENVFGNNSQDQRGFSSTTSARTW